MPCTWRVLRKPRRRLAEGHAARPRLFPVVSLVNQSPARSQAHLNTTRRHDGVACRPATAHADHPRRWQGLISVNHAGCPSGRPPVHVYLYRLNRQANEPDNREQTMNECRRGLCQLQGECVVRHTQVSNTAQILSAFRLRLRFGGRGLGCAIPNRALTAFAYRLCHLCPRPCRRPPERLATIEDRL